MREPLSDRDPLRDNSSPNKLYKLNVDQVINKDYKPVDKDSLRRSASGSRERSSGLRKSQIMVYRRG